MRIKRVGGQEKANVYLHACTFQGTDYGIEWVLPIMPN